MGFYKALFSGSVWNWVILPESVGIFGHNQSLISSPIESNNVKMLIVFKIMFYDETGLLIKAQEFKKCLKLIYII